MYKKIKNHYKEISKIISDKSKNYDLKEVIKYNKRFINYFQAERLIHLLVTISISILFFTTFC